MDRIILFIGGQNQLISVLHTAGVSIQLLVEILRDGTASAEHDHVDQLLAGRKTAYNRHHCEQIQACPGRHIADGKDDGGQQEKDKGLNNLRFFMGVRIAVVAFLGYISHK